MIVRVVVCPGAPVLVPGMSPALASTVPDLLAGCDAAIAALAAADRILLVTSGPRSRDLGVTADGGSVVHRAGTAVSSALLTGGRLPPHFQGRLPGGSDLPDEAAAPGTPAAAPGVGVIVGAALLAKGGIELPTIAVELGDLESGAGDTDPAAAVLAAAQTSPERVAILLIGEGSASRGAESPGGGHDGAEAFDAGLSAALADGSPRALAEAVQASATMPAALVFTSGPSLRALAGMTRDRPPTHAEVRYDAAPLGVGYLVALWSWD